MRNNVIFRHAFDVNFCLKFVLQIAWCVGTLTSLHTGAFAPLQLHPSD